LRTAKLRGKGEKEKKEFRRYFSTILLRSLPEYQEISIDKEKKRGYVVFLFYSFSLSGS